MKTLETDIEIGADDSVKLLSLFQWSSPSHHPPLKPSAIRSNVCYLGLTPKHEVDKEWQFEAKWKGCNFQ